MLWLENRTTRCQLASNPISKHSVIKGPPPHECHWNVQITKGIHNFPLSANSSNNCVGPHLEKFLADTPILHCDARVSTFRSENMAPNSQTTISSTLLKENFGIFTKMSLKFDHEHPVDSISSGNGSVPNRWWTIAWTNVVQDVLHYMVTLGHANFIA